MTKPNDRPALYSGPRGGLARRISKALFGFMLKEKRIAIDFGNQSLSEGEFQAAEFVLAPPSLSQTARILLAPNFWVGESFIKGEWYLKKGNLSDFLGLIRAQAAGAYGSYYRLRSKLRGFRHYAAQYIFNRSYTRKVKKHYDVDASIYELFLDPEMVYTCGFFSEDHRDLPEAQQQKIAAVISRLELPDESPRVLDIGCGWGAIERALVRRHPTASITGLSISRTQIEWALENDTTALRPDERSRIEYRLEDYDKHGRAGYYDAVCAVGMIEHVGLGGYAAFFSNVERFLKPGGRALVHTIISPESDTPTNPWIDKHIFTGGYAPSIAELVRATEQSSLRVTGVHIYEPDHYFKTIGFWIENLVRNIPRMKSYLSSCGHSEESSEELVRTWLFYLSGVRNMFSRIEAKPHQVAHVGVRKL